MYMRLLIGLFTAENRSVIKFKKKKLAYFAQGHVSSIKRKKKQYARSLL